MQQIPGIFDFSCLIKANAQLSYAAPMDIEGFACDAFQMKEAALKCKEGQGSAMGGCFLTLMFLGKEQVQSRNPYLCWNTLE